MNGRLDRWVRGVALLSGTMLGACSEVIPTATDDDLFPIEPQTVEILLPYEDFGGAIQIIGGYGSASELGRAPVATDFDGLDSRAILRWSDYPSTATVLDSAGVNRPDSLLTYIGGRVVVYFDTITSQTEEPVRVQIARTTREWHAPTVSWTNQVDTIGDLRAWPEPGGGPFEVLGDAPVERATGDSIVIPVDSATVAAWADTTDASRGMLVTVLDPGRRLDLELLQLRLDARSSIRPDTVVELSTFPSEISFIYDPLPDPPPDGLRVGGTPAWRSYMRVRAVLEIDEPNPICERFQCPLAVTAERLNQADLVLTTRPSELAYQPVDTTSLDVRSVLAPDLLPKAPLGGPLAGVSGREMPPELFVDGGGQQVNLPITSFIRALLADIESEKSDGTPPPDMLTLLAIAEPATLGFLSFEGPGSASPPRLRLILTLSQTVEIR